MASRLQVTFRGMLPSEALRKFSEARFRKVTTRLPPASHCHLVLARPVGNQHKGADYCARVQLRGRSPGVFVAAEASHADAYVAIREAFERAKEQAATLGARRATSTPFRVVRRRLLKLTLVRSPLA